MATAPSPTTRTRRQARLAPPEPRWRRWLLLGLFFGLGHGLTQRLMEVRWQEDAGLHRELARELTGGAASLIRPGLLLLRFLGSAGAVRGAMAAAIPALRAAALGLPPLLPRLWTC